MLLTKFHVTDFHSVQDSGWIDAEQITALIGTNESGKTNIMLPLWKLNPAAEVEDLLPKAKLAKVIARFLPRPEDTEDEFDDVVVDNKPICNQIEEFAKAQGIDLGKGWKVRLAAMVKREILKGTEKVICESDPEFAKILELFNRFS